MFLSLLKRLFRNYHVPVGPDECRRTLLAGNLDAAVHCYRDYLARHPDDASAHNDLGVALQRLGRHGEALNCYETVMQLAPANADAWYNAAQIYHLRGHVAQAENCYQGRALRRSAAPGS